MIIRQSLWLLCFIAFSAVVQGQKIHPWQIDGELYLKYHNEYPIPVILDITDSRYPQLPGIPAEVSEQFGIYNIEAPFAAAQDIKLRHTLRVYFNKSEKIDELLKVLEAQAAIEYAEPVPYNVLDYTPNDLGSNSFSSGQWGLYKIMAREAWDISKGDSNITVAIVDDGLRVLHPDLNGNVWRNPGEIAGNKVDDDNNGYVDDVYGYDVADKDPDPAHPSSSFTHGTHVGGIVGATTDNGVGVASIGFNISLIGVKCTYNAQTNTQSIPTGYEGITYAANAGADVINCSWSSGGPFSQTAQDVIDYAVSKGCIVVGAASNSGVEEIRYPAAYTGVIAVASTEQDETKSSYSNYGTWVDVTAPGSSIRSTFASGTGYNYLTGTSMSTPFVSGLLGLMKSHNPNLTAGQLEQCLLDNVDNIDAVNQTYLGKLGRGRINAYKAMQCVDATINAQPKAQIQSSISVACPNTQVTYYGSSTQAKATTYQWYFPGGSPSTSTAQNPTVVYSNPGRFNVTLVITNNNGKDSLTLVNYIEVSAYGREVVYEEDFESGTLASMGFAVENPDNGATWAVVNANGVPGSSKALRMNFYSYNAVGQRDAVITPVINLAQNANTRLNLIHAYRRQNATKRDSLLVYASTDGGNTFPYLLAAYGENGQYNFATQAILATSFAPTMAADWCFETITGAGCIDLDLSDFDGEASFALKFETYNDFGNNLFIDNIKVTGNCAQYNTSKPTALFSSNDSAFCLPRKVKFKDESRDFPTSYQWAFEGGNPAASTVKSPEVSYNSPGTYDVTLIVTNAFGADTIVMQDFITGATPPSVLVNAGKTTICRGESTYLTAKGANLYTWSPIFAISSTSGDSVIVSPPTSFTYNVKGTSVEGCEDTRSVSITVLPGPGVTNITRQGDSIVATNSNTNITYQWRFNGGDIQGAEGKSLKLTATGSYSVRTTDSAGCSSTSLDYYYQNVSVNNISGNDAVKIYPNPATGSLFINNQSNNTHLDIKIFNYLGEQVVKYQLVEKNNELDITNLSSGVYFVVLQNSEINTTQKVIIYNE